MPLVEPTLGGLQVPTVTSVDLERFHRRHFGASDSSINLVFPSHYTDTNPTYSGTGEELGQEDDLGYYPDGVKRTLTDEQISMFRHSEIYAILRKRQLQKENGHVDEESQTLPVTSDSLPDDVSLAYGENEVEHMVHGRDQVNMEDISVTKDGGYNPARKRSKKNVEITSRRQARELDDAVADAGFLDYGEDMSISQSKESSDRTHRTLINYADQDPLESRTTSQEDNPPREGRKIWWPMIG
ncbi:MAG: hypothetical protein Q9213_007763 [Squamulea squamosa]